MQQLILDRRVLGTGDTGTGMLFDCDGVLACAGGRDMEQKGVPVELMKGVFRPDGTPEIRAATLLYCPEYIGADGELVLAIDLVMLMNDGLNIGRRARERFLTIAFWALGTHAMFMGDPTPETGFSVDGRPFLDHATCNEIETALLAELDLVHDTELRVVLGRMPGSGETDLCLLDLPDEPPSLSAMAALPVDLSVVDGMLEEAFSMPEIPERIAELIEVG